MVLAIVAVLAVGFFGLRAYNANTYTVMQHMSLSDVTYETNDSVRAITGDYLRGFHFTPAKRTHPGVVVVYGGSEGSPDYERAQAIAAQGYQVLALYFWGQDGQAQTLANVPLDQFSQVESYIKDHISQPEPVTVVGTSKGAEFAAELAAHGFAIDNLVCFAPADRSYFGLDFSSGSPQPSFTYQGQPVPFASYTQGDLAAGAKMLWDTATNYPPSYRAVYESIAAGTGDDSRIDLSGFKGNAVFFAGGSDALWQSDTAAQSLTSQSGAFEAHVYADAGHLFAADSDALGTGWDIMFGGTAEGNAAAYRDSNAILYDRLARWHGQM
ncbi:MAG: acyl-CoA thioester hydrolase [Eggerthellaceae bacterium]